MTRLHSGERPFVDRPAHVDERAVLTVLRVPKEMAGMRVDLFIQTQLKDTSRTRAKQIVKAAAYHLDGRRAKPNGRVAAEQLIALWRPPWDEVEVPREIPVLHEDEHVLVINKPAGLPVHPSARYYRNTVIKMLESRFPSSHLVLAHRLDRDTSGVLILARTHQADRRIKAQFEAREGVDKSYLALTWGWPERDRLRIEVPLERDLRARLRVLMKIAAPGTGLEARTVVTVLQRLRRGERRYALVRCDLETGRQHQIRIHLKSIGCPVVGDKLYGPDSELHARSSDNLLSERDREVLEMERHALHAWKLGLHHPMSGERLELTAAPPQDMLSFLGGLELVEQVEPVEAVGHSPLGTVSRSTFDSA
jgi:23S rRNA pseudouridine1911/1915/1917 synthase